MTGLSFGTERRTSRPIPQARDPHARPSQRNDKHDTTVEADAGQDVPPSDPALSRSIVYLSLDKIILFLSSLRLTIILLALGMVLVFAGTIAQVDLGLYKAQNDYFRSFFVYWGPRTAGWRIPVLPGGYTVGGLLLINLITAHFNRFHFSKKKVGIWMTHVGLILLLVGQLLTDMLSHETHIWLSEGQSKNYSDSSAHVELAVIDTSNPSYDHVVAFGEKLVTAKGELKDANLPFTIRVKDYFVNSEPQVHAPMMAKGPPQASNGAGKSVEFAEAVPTVSLDSRNIPAAIVEVVTPEGSLGTWVVSSWLAEEKLLQILAAGFRNQAGEQMGSRLARTVNEPQEFTFKGHTYQLALRPVRFYKPFSIELQKFSHDRYAGTDIPKNFSSRIRVRRPDTGEDREVLIKMNTPLRYGGETFYQSGFDDVDPTVTILQVVHNPGWLAPYFACFLVGAGLLVQFSIHLLGFVRRKST
jgi:hypothetical protein